MEDELDLYDVLRLSHLREDATPKQIEDAYLAIIGSESDEDAKSRATKAYGALSYLPHRVSYHLHLLGEEDYYANLELGDRRLVATEKEIEDSVSRMVKRIVMWKKELLVQGKDHPAIQHLDEVSRGIFKARKILSDPAERKTYDDFCREIEMGLGRDPVEPVEAAAVEDIDSIVALIGPPSSSKEESAKKTPASVKKKKVKDAGAKKVKDAGAKKVKDAGAKPQQTSASDTEVAEEVAEVVDTEVAEEVVDTEVAEEVARKRRKKKNKRGYRRSVWNKTKKIQPKKDWSLMDEIYRLAGLRYDFANNLDTMVHLSELFGNLDTQYMDYGEHTLKEQNLKPFIKSFDSVVEAFKMISGDLDLLANVFTQMQKPESANVLCGDLRSIKYQLSRIEKVSASLDYQKGTLYFEGGLSDNRSFVRTKTPEIASKLFEVSRPIEDDATGVCKPDLYFTHKDQPVLVFDSFEKFEDDRHLMRSVTAPRFNAAVLGYPNKVTQMAIISILEGVNNMIKVKCMHSRLDDINTFVLSTVNTTKGEKSQVKRNIKILGINRVLEHGENLTELDMKRLQQGVYKRCLKESSDGEIWKFDGGYRKKFDKKWPERDEFLNNFCCTSVKLDVRVNMLLTASFLKKSYWSIILYFPHLFHAVEARELFHNRHVLALPWCFTEEFKQKIMPEGKWSRKIMPKGEVPKDEVDQTIEWCDKFQRVFDYENLHRQQPNDQRFINFNEAVASPYDEEDPMDLIEYLRHLVIHHCSSSPKDKDKGEMSAEYIFHGINRCWPGLIEETHKLVYSLTEVVC